MAKRLEEFLKEQKERMERAGVQLSSMGDSVQCTEGEYRQQISDRATDPEKIKIIAEAIEYGETYRAIVNLSYRLASLGFLVDLGRESPTTDNSSLQLNGYNWESYNTLLNLAHNLELLQKVNLNRSLFERLQWEVILPARGAIIARVQGKKTWPELKIKVIRHKNQPQDAQRYERLYNFDMDYIQRLIDDAEEVAEKLN